jgi:hypothetical protein
MRFLFAISILSFGALLWAALAAARHLRAGRQRILQLGSQRPLQEVFEAGEFRTPRSLRLVQSITRSVTRSATSSGTEAQPVPEFHPRLREEKRRRRQSAATPLVIALEPAAPMPPLPAPLADRRKAPQSVRPAAEDGTDRALYNRDLGGLTDPPYTPPLRAATAASGSSLNRS